MILCRHLKLQRRLSPPLHRPRSRSRPGADGAAALALVVANSPLFEAYDHALHQKIAGLSLLHWINDALMAVFFLLVGLEIKREVVDGQLARWDQRVLPGLAALGGMAAPALFYVLFNLGGPDTLRGWAIPAATDIAFALGVLSLLGPRVPASLKVFLAALAIIDDLAPSSSSPCSIPPVSTSGRWGARVSSSCSSSRSTGPASCGLRPIWCSAPCSGFWCCAPASTPRLPASSWR